MSLEIAWKQNILVTAFHLLKSLLVVLGFGSQAFVCGFSRQNINSVFLFFNPQVRVNFYPLRWDLPFQITIVVNPPDGKNSTCLAF